MGSDTIFIHVYDGIIQLSVSIDGAPPSLRDPRPAAAHYPARRALFAAEADYQFFRDALVEAAAKHGLAIHGYVWVTNHVHLLATPEFDDSISKTFQSVGRRYVQYFNYTYKRSGTFKRSGTLWEGRYRATVVDSERYLLTLMRYIEMNPVRAGMVAAPQ